MELLQKDLVFYLLKLKIPFYKQQPSVKELNLGCVCVFKEAFKTKKNNGVDASLFYLHDADKKKRKKRKRFLH